MKHARNLWLAILLMSLPAVSPAQGPDAPEPGWSGRLQAGGFFLQSDSQLATHGSNRRIDDLDGPADTQQTGAALASLYLRYQFEGGTALYAGNPLEAGEGVALAVGVSQPIGASTLDVSLKWLPIEEVWENPYQTSGARDETDVDAYGLKIEWQQVGGSPWEVTYGVDRFDVDDDVIGDIESDLERDGWTHEVGVAYTLSLQPGTNLQPQLAYTYADKEGLSNSYHGVKIGALLQRARPPWVLIGVLQGAFHQYQETHPLFDKTREETQMTVFAQVMRLNLLGNPRLFTSVGGGYVLSKSNIDFFDSQTLIGLASVGINF